DPGFFGLGNHRWNDDKKGGHGWVDMYRSIVASCDVYYYQLANDMGIDNISNFMAPFGFGQKSGIDLPGEKQGVLPSQDWKRRTFRKPGAGKWVAGDTVSIGIGQGFNTYTPLQMAQATSILANNGVVFRPHLVGFIEDSATGQRTPTVSQPASTIPLKQANIDVVKNAMVGVNREGTGATAFRNAGYISAGKTGTAQVFSLKGEKYNANRLHQNLKDNAWFVAFAPADKPRIAIALIVENGGWGAEAAAPIARKVFDYYLLGKQPAPEPGEAKAASPDTNEEDTDPTSVTPDTPQ
ncbi:MAG: penicillin-binding protein 2, partial [Burkholderiales bacterium]|nr:penicillin-binding protein 2 [Burkholderiales bacterium]